VSSYVTTLMATAPEMLKNVSGIDIEALIRKLTSSDVPAFIPEAAVVNGKEIAPADAE
jgi:flotillin